MGVSSIVWVFLSFFSVEALPNNGGITLRALPCMRLLEPYTDPYEDWKNKLV